MRADRQKIVVRLVLVLCCMVLWSVPLRAQYVQFTLPHENPVLLNPALAGSGSQMRANFLYKNQWFHIRSPYQTYGFSYDATLGYYGMHSLAVSAVNDMQGLGVLNNTEVFLYYAYAWDVSYNFRLRLGLQAGFLMKNTNYFGLIFPDMLNAAPGEYEEPNYRNRTAFAPDFGLGVTGEVGALQFGAAVHHIAEPRFDVRQQAHLVVPRKVSAFVSYQFNPFGMYKFRKPLYITPRMVATWQERYIDLMFGSDVQYLGVKAGLWYRSSLLFPRHDLAVSVGWENQAFAFTYAYNMGLMGTKFVGLNTAIHEFHVQFKVSYGKKRGLAPVFNKKKKRKLAKYSRKKAVAASKRNNVTK